MRGCWLKKERLLVESGWYPSAILLRRCTWVCARAARRGNRSSRRGEGRPRPVEAEGGWFQLLCQTAGLAVGKGLVSEVFLSIGERQAGAAQAASAR